MMMTMMSKCIESNLSSTIIKRALENIFFFFLIVKHKRITYHILIFYCSGWYVSGICIWKSRNLLHEIVCIEKFQINSVPLNVVSLPLSLQLPMSASSWNAFIDSCFTSNEVSVETERHSAKKDGFIIHFVIKYIVRFYFECYFFFFFLFLFQFLRSHESENSRLLPH